MINFETKKNGIARAIGYQAYSKFSEEARRSGMRRLVQGLSDRRGDDLPVEVVALHAKMFDDDLMRYFPALPWAEVELAVEWGMALGEWGDYVRLSAQNLTRCVNRYMESDERKAVVSEMRRNAERGRRQEEWEVNLNNWNYTCSRAYGAWKSFVEDGTAGDYRRCREADGKEWARLVLRHCLSNAWRWMLTVGLATDDPSRRASCAAAARREGCSDGEDARVYTDALMLEWSFRDARLQGRDLGAEMDAVSARTTDSERMCTKLRMTA